MPHKDPDLRRAYMAKYRAEHRPQIRGWVNKSYRKTRGYLQKKKNNWQTNGITDMTIDRYFQMVAEQDGRCAICFQKPLNMELGVDHDHKTGLSRGLLCTKCNTGIGFLGEDIARLMQAIKYIEKYHGGNHGN